MEKRKPYSNDYLPNIIPDLARTRAKKHGYSLGKYLEKLVTDEAEKVSTLGEAIHDEAAVIARVGGFITEALSALERNDMQAARSALLLSKRVHFERFKQLQPHIAEHAKMRAQDRWKEEGGTGALPDYGSNVAL